MGFRRIGAELETDGFQFRHGLEALYMMDAVLVASDNPDLRKLRAEATS